MPRAGAVELRLSPGWVWHSSAELCWESDSYLALHVPGILPSLTNHLSHPFLPLPRVVNLLLLINL